MIRKMMKLAMLPVVALSLVVAACDQAGELTGPSSSGAVATSDVSSYTVVKEKDVSVGVVTGTIGSAGGKLILGKHELWVPKDAVSGATVFTMSKAGDDLRFSLTATQLLTNDVGSKGFAYPVKLVVNYKDALNVSDPSLLRVFWAKLDGTFEAQPTEVDVQGYRAVGHLKHFSDYVLAMP